MTIVRRLAVVAALLLWVSPIAAQQAGSWNQEKVTQIAKQLADATGTLEASVRKLPPPPVGAQRKAFYNSVQLLRRLESETRVLARELAEGRGLDETLPIYKQVNLLRRDAAEESRSALVIPDDVLAKVDKARDLLQQLSGYYQE